VIAPLALDAHRAVRRMIARGSHRVGHTHKEGWALVPKETASLMGQAFRLLN
jgi:hypothetical protein